MDRRKRYTNRHPRFRQFVSKISWIKAKHGAAAKEYFLTHLECEDCEENRLACLSVHHVHGKSYDIFEVLCRNCHALRHGGYATAEDGYKECLVNYRLGRPHKIT